MSFAKPRADMLFSKVSKKYAFPLDKAKDNDLVILPHRLPKVEAA